MHVHAMGKEFEFSVVLDGVIFYIYDSGRILFRSAPLRVPLHRHFSYELRYVFEGIEQVVTETDNTTVGAGELCFLGRNAYHAVRADGLVRLAFNVEIGPVDESAKEGKKLERIRECLEGIGTQRVFKDEYVSMLMNEVYKMFLSGNGTATETHKGMLLVCVFLRMIDIIAEEKGIRYTPFGRLERTREFERKRLIEHHIAQFYNEDGGLSRLARSLYLSEKQAGAQVRKLMGASYKSLIAEKRLTMANRLMRQPQLSLMEIARSVGYSSYNGFFIAYKKLFGCLPEESKKRIAAQDYEYEKMLEEKILSHHK